MTVLSISALLLLLVGWITILGLERKTARSYSEATRAELALESGLAGALATIASLTHRDDSLVFRLDDPLVTSNESFFTYGAIYENDAWKAVPLFSGTASVPLGDRQIDARLLSAELATYASTAEPLLSHQRYPEIPPVQWIELPSDPDHPSKHTLHYAYWIEDLSGRIDGKHAASQTREHGQSTAELDFSTIFDPQVSSENIPPQMDEKRDSLRTTASLRHVIDPAEAAKIEPYIAYLPNATPPPKIIPHGFGYPDAGQPARDLNELVSTADVDGIASHIARNLTDFSDRRGGFPASQDYVKTLSASIIDYADSDSDATLGIDYRGVDSYPFVNELFDRYEWVEGNPGEVDIKVETFVELWNPCQLPITGEMTFTNDNQHKIRIPLGDDQTFSAVEFPPRQVSIPPNGFAVIALGEHTYTFPEGSNPPSSLTFLTTNESHFVLKWNNRIVDLARGGLQRTSGILRAGNSERKWKGNASPANDSSIGQAGDPRASYYIDTPVIANSYDVNSNWGGRVLKRKIFQDSPTSPYAEVRISRWPDRGSSSLPGIKPVGDSRRPGSTQILNSDGSPYPGHEYPPNQPDRAPAFISNSGRYRSLAELGNIFDPAQWDDVLLPTATASPNAGGGFSLAIGRPEFAAFDHDGQRAAQLMDLFTVHPETPSQSTHPRPINLNTAPREVLRCLVVGVSLNADPMAPQVALSHDQHLGDRFADVVISHRNQSPFRSHSDLNILRKNPLDPPDPDDLPFFGNPAHFDQVPEVIDPLDPNDLIEWDDAGREELLRKVMNLVTFHSKTFRIVVAGEVRSDSGKRIARAAREFHFTVEPERDPNGLALPNGKLLITKHYESNL